MCLFYSLFVLVSFLLPLSASAQTVPHYLNFQSIVPDDNGNLIKDPFVDMNFKILDSQGNLLYEEDQKSVQVIKGIVNVTIGEGTVPNSNPASPTGGIPRDVFDPTEGAHFLRVAVGNNSPMDDFELMSVPYSVWSERALSIVPNSIGTEEIKDGSIKLEDLEPGLAFSNIAGTAAESQLPATMATDVELTAHTSSSTAHQANQITVRGPYLATDPTNVEDVLQALDRRVMHFYRNSNEFLGDEREAREAAVSAEAAARVNADNLLSGRITDEQNARISADNTLQSNIDTEEAARIAGDSAEAAARTAAEGVLQGNINTEAATRSTADAAHTAANSGVHGVGGGQVVGTDLTQTLLNKTLASPVVSGNLDMDGGNITDVGTVDGVDVANLNSTVNLLNATVSTGPQNHEDRLTALEGVSVPFSEVTGQIAESQVPAALRPRAWGIIEDTSNDPGCTVLRSYNIVTPVNDDGAFGCEINLTFSFGHTNYIVLVSRSTALLPDITYVDGNTFRFSGAMSPPIRFVVFGN